MAILTNASPVACLAPSTGFTWIGSIWLLIAIVSFYIFAFFLVRGVKGMQKGRNTGGSKVMASNVRSFKIRFSNGKEYEIEQLPSLKAHEWRLTIFDGPIKDALGQLANIGQIDTKNTTQITDLFNSLKGALIELSPTELFDLALTYIEFHPKYALPEVDNSTGLVSKELKIATVHPIMADREEILNSIYDEELLDLLWGVIQLAVPLEKIQSLFGRKK